MLDQLAPRSQRNAPRLERTMLDDFNRRACERTITPAALLPRTSTRPPPVPPLHASCADRASCWNTSRSNAPSESAYRECAA